ncbi:hypothetical protein HYU16_03560 [Candidatus Woesearchaeota archaeon]|nr:hypothetical protein [Candidatus Woesearchaeota archaeon]
MSNKISVEDRAEKEGGKGKQQAWQKPEPQQMQQHQQREQASHHRHHERNIVLAFAAVGVVVILGFFMARYAINLVSGDGTVDNAEESRYYNGFEFVTDGSTWFTQWKGDELTYNLQLRHPPWEVENVTVKGQVDWRFQMPGIFITFDPPENFSRQNSFLFLASVDLTSNLDTVLDRTVIAACTANLTEACTQRPIVTCSTNASVIYLKVSNETGVFLDGNCATIQGYEKGLTRAADKVIYQWLKIIRK